MRNLTMMDPTNFGKIIDTHFAVRVSENQPLTVPALALACGFSRTSDIVNTLREAEEGESPYPQSSITALTRAVTKIEDYCLTNGLMGKFPAPLTKFCLGAYHSVKDTNENSNQGVTQLAIVFSDIESQQPQLARIKQPDAIEFTMHSPTPQVALDTEIMQMIANL